VVDTGSDMSAGSSPPRPAVEWPTIAVVAAVYGSFLLVTFAHRSLPWPVTVLLLGIVSAWHGSLQHEFVHRHGVRNRTVAQAIMWPTLNLWVPFADYRRSHLRHHADLDLTDPFDDPESTYRSVEDWERLSPTMQRILWVNRTLIGRMVVGPFIAFGRYMREQATAIRRNEHKARSVWADHAVAVLVTLVWVVAVCHLPVWQFLLGSVYLGTSLTLVRSFAEHTWTEPGVGRTAVIGSRGFWGLLFLNNNLHVTHHASPDVPWYRLPALTRSINAVGTAVNGAGHFNGYAALFARYAFRPKCQPFFPGHIVRSSGSGDAGGTTISVTLGDPGAGLSDTATLS
jgi:fatty acid desaturase